MGRPLKVGLDYFPVDLNIAEDGPVAFVEAKYGIAAFGVLIKLLIKIYRQGYYMTWTEQDQYLFLKHTPTLDITALQNIVSAYINASFFNKNIADTYQVLTSHGIQKRYITACERRNSVALCQPYACIVPNCEDFPTDNVRLIPLIVNNNPVSANMMSTITPVNDADSTQSRVEQSRVEQSKAIYHPVGDILQLWNDLATDLPHALKSSDKRRSSIEARWKSHPSLDEFAAVFKRVQASDFLTGRNGKGFACGIDWVLKPNNWDKIREGNYDNRRINGSKPSGMPGNQSTGSITRAAERAEEQQKEGQL